MYDFGLVGLGVMGRNFILNVADNGFSAYGYDLDEEKVNPIFFIISTTRISPITVMVVVDVIWTILQT